jgi:hypothetical protein
MCEVCHDQSAPRNDKVTISYRRPSQESPARAASPKTGTLSGIEGRKPIQSDVLFEAKIGKA